MIRRPAMKRAVMRGARRGAYIGLTGDQRTLRQLRRQIKEQDVTAVSWQAAGRSIDQTMKQVDRQLSNSRSR